MRVALKPAHLRAQAPRPRAAEVRSFRLRRAWEVFDRPAYGPVVPGTVPVFVVGVTLGAIASVVSIRSGHNFDYPDTLSHLTIARRVLDSESPGTQQLGAVWPPFPHLLVFPLVQWMWLWSTGIAAAIVGSLSVGVASAGLYRILARLGCDATGRLLGLLALWATIAAWMLARAIGMVGRFLGPRWEHVGA